MKKLLSVAVVSLLMVACSSPKTEEATTTSGSDDMKALFEKNLATLKAGIASFEKEDVAGWAANVADTAVWNSPAYGDTVHTKAHWTETLQYYVDNWDSIHLVNPQFLPGIDSDTKELDGSVRYYGRWDAVHKSGLKTQVNFYGTYDFNTDGKITFGAEYFDVGGVMKAVQGGQ